MGVIERQKVQIPFEQVFDGVLHSEVLNQQMLVQFPALIDGISRLSPTDAVIFRDTYQQEAICYANSWLYLLRSARNDQGEFGYKFVGKEALIGIGYRHHTAYVVHPIGVGRFQATVEVCASIYQSLHCPIILKKIDQALYEYLSATQLFRQHANDLTLLEEEAFPEHTLQLETLFSPDDGTCQPSLPLRKKVKRFAKSPMKLQARADVSWSELESSPGFPHLFGPNPDKYHSYRQMIKEACSPRASEGTYRVCAYYDDHQTIHGLYISELLAQGTMGLYCAVSSKSFPGITEWMDYDFFQQLFLEGIHTLYLGGSETEGVHAYVQKLLPISPPYLMRPMEMCCTQGAGSLHRSLFP